MTTSHFRAESLDSVEPKNTLKPRRTVKPKNKHEQNSMLEDVSRSDFDEKQSSVSSRRETSVDLDALAFLPAALEVERTPSSRAGRMIIWLIVLFFSLAIAWAVLGKVDIVAVAHGKVIPNESVKQIQSLETARVRHVRVQEGQQVKAGDVLIELDDALAIAELKGYQAQLHGLQQDSARLARLAQFLLFDEAAFRDQVMIASLVNKLDDGEALLSLLQQSKLAQERAEIQNRMLHFLNQEQTLQAEQAMTLAEITKKQRSIPILQERVQALAKLHEKDLGSRMQWLEFQQTLINEQQDLAVHTSELERLRLAEKGIPVQRNLFLSEKRKQVLSEQIATQTQRESLEQTVKKAEQRLDHFVIKAPIDGQVQQLAVETIGGVVQSAQLLMHIVPSQSALEVEAMVLNRDIGFVHEGQTVAVKVDTFNFTRYGMLGGTVRLISDDAIEDESLGLVYAARVRLDSDELAVDEKWIRLSPGMAVTAEMKTGQRRLIEFFLSPLLRYQQESLTER